MTLHPNRRRPVLLALAVAAAGAAIASMAGAELGLKPHLDVAGPRLSRSVTTDLEVIGDSRGLIRRDRQLRCREGDHACDQDDLQNGVCEFWVRFCFDAPDGGTIDPSGLHVLNAASDPQLPVLERTLAHMRDVDAPKGGTRSCGTLARFDVPLDLAPTRTPKGSRKIILGAGPNRSVFKLTCETARQAHGISFRRIQQDIFEKKQCATSGCHGLPNPQGGLNLDGSQSYDNLVGQPAQSSAKKLIDPGKPENSFLIDKLKGQLLPSEGKPMPLDRPQLSQAEINAISQWIAAGAPFKGTIKGSLTTTLPEQPPFDPPPPAPGVFRAVAEPLPLGDIPEINECEYVRLGNPEDTYIGRWELHMLEGGHHVGLRRILCDDRNGNGVNDCDEPGFDAQFPHRAFCLDYERIATSVRDGGSTSKDSVTDYDTEHTGVAIPIHRNQPVLVAYHFAAGRYQKTTAAAYVDAVPVDPSLVTRTLASNYELFAYAMIDVPPNAKQVPSWFACTFADCPFAGPDGTPGGVIYQPIADNFAVFGLNSHMHSRSPKYTIDLLDEHNAPVSRVGSLNDQTDPDTGTGHLYFTTDFENPQERRFAKPFLVHKGEHLNYSCYYDNGVEQPVKMGCEETPGVPPGKSIVEVFPQTGDLFSGMVKTCKVDADCVGYGTGKCVPAKLVYGHGQDDAMCGMLVYSWACPDDDLDACLALRSTTPAVTP